VAVTNSSGLAGLFRLSIFPLKIKYNKWRMYWLLGCGRRWFVDQFVGKFLNQFDGKESCCQKESAVYDFKCVH